MSQPVHPVSTTGGNTSPPNAVGVGAAPVTVEMQPVVMQPINLQTQPAVIQVTQPAAQTVTVAYRVERRPYLEYCPRCQTTVTTRVEHKIGIYWWFICLIGTFLFCWPILFALCCDCSKDVVHYCPNCGTMLTIRRK